MENISEISTDVFDLIPPRKVQFWILISFEILSLTCTLYLFCYFLIHKHLRQALHNHILIILLTLSFVTEVIDYPLYLDAYLHNGRNSFDSSSRICLLWWMIDFGVYGAITVFLAWASFERHLLIFHYNRFLSTQSRRILFHYIPLGILSLYLLGFYSGVIVFPPCENTFDYTKEGCGMLACYESVPWLSFWDFVVHGVVCTLIETVCSVTLLIRVIQQKHRAHQRPQWRKHRKMTIQLLSVSSLSLSITLPQTLITAVQQVIPGMEDFGLEASSYFFFLTIFVVLLLPVVILCSMPKLWPRARQQRATVAPLAMNLVKKKQSQL